jgi:lipopolysaccharide biosynthesis protein
MGKLESNLAGSRVSGSELVRRVHELERDVREAVQQNKVLLETSQEKEEQHIRQLATLNRADYQGQFPSSSVSLRRLSRSRRKKLRELSRHYHILASSPLFDGEWYLANNSDVAAVRMDPVLHYLLYGAREGRQPGPQFDAVAYLRRYEDLAIKNENPLLHYILHGSQEGRLAGPRSSAIITEPSATKGMLVVDHDCSVAVPFAYMTRPQVAGQPIAVIIHIFYPELASELRYYLEKIPGQVDIFISTTNSHSKLLIEQVFIPWKAGALEIRHTPNRGRDIAPKLVVFRDVYDRYDLVLQLHSKHSSHTNGSASWRRHLLETLVGDPVIIACIIDAFNRNPELGMISSSHFEPMRGSLSWGNNFDCAVKLAHRMGFSVELTTTLDFPSGSMLWVRSAALRPLFDLELSMDDFDVEEDQVDGTLAHAIERLYFFICESAGFSWIKISRPDLFPTLSTVSRIERPDDIGRVLHKPFFRLVNPSQCNFRPPTLKYVPQLAATPPSENPAKLVAFYLPQFHTIPENDAWWGEGFTEWTNVRAAIPLFEGHYQPHVPVDLGYYNLLDDNVLKRQAELARLYGIDGFCFYCYWFGGKKLLFKPLEMFLAHKTIDISFCLCWANENWTRRWDGRENEILIAQKHSDEDDIEFIKSVSGYMRDERYIRVNGRPLLLVYRPDVLPSLRDTANRWRRWCVENGIGPIYLAYTQSFEAIDPMLYGCDAAIEFPPNHAAPRNITTTVTPTVNDFEATVYDWNSLLENSYYYSRQNNYKLFRSVCPMWDNTPRRKSDGTVFVNNTPLLYKRWLLNAIAETVRTATNADERLIFINAWNEWGEGAHLEPDAQNGYAYLQATREALEAYSCEALETYSSENET